MHVAASQDTLGDIIELIEGFFIGLRMYIGVPPTLATTDDMVQIAVKVLDILMTAIEGVKQSPTSEFNLHITFEADTGLLKSMVGRADLYGL